MPAAYRTFSLGLVMSCVLGAPVPGQSMSEKACQIIQSDSYDVWVERLSAYEDIIVEASGSLSDAQMQQVAQAIEDNWRRHLFAPNATSTSDPGELRYAKSRACSSAVQDIVQERVNKQSPIDDEDLLDQTEAVLGEEWRERGEMNMMLSLLIRFGPSCDDFRTSAISSRANDLSSKLHAPSCPFNL